MVDKILKLSFILPIIMLIMLPSVASSQQKYLIFTQHCYQQLIVKLNLNDTQCITLTISKSLGYGIVVGSSLVKIPQLIKILANKSVYGISFYGVIMELLTNWVTIVYNWHHGNPFNIYGENVFLALQNVIILALFIIFARNVPSGVPIPAKGTTTKYVIFFIAFMLLVLATRNHEIWPQLLIVYSMIFQMILFSGARLTQIYHNFKQKSTGHLSLITWFLCFVGAFTRFMTVFRQARQDYVLLFVALNAAFLNGIIVSQFFIYAKNNNKTQKTQ